MRTRSCISPADRTRRALALAAAFLATAVCAANAHAQTNDIYFRGWSWTTDAGTTRAMGMAGAAVALDDDLSALDTNPATLASLERTELGIGVARRGSGRTSANDLLQPQTGLGHAGFGARLGQRWAIGVFRSEPQATRIDLADQITAVERAESGHLDAVTTDAGGAVALRLSRKSAIGVRVTATRFSVESEYVIVEGLGLPWYRVGIGDSSTTIVTTAGAHLAPARGLRLGVAYTTGGAWSLERTSISPRLNLNIETDSSFVVRRPSLLSAGAAWRASPWLQFVAQVDRLDFGKLDEGHPGGYATVDYVKTSWRERAGVELSRSFRSFALQARAGVAASWPEATLQTVSAPSRGVAQAPAYTDAGGRDVTAAPSPTGSGDSTGPPIEYQNFRAFDGATGLWDRTAESDSRSAAVERAVVTGGLSFVTRAGLRLDLALHASRARVVTVAGATLRF
jgi:hypothetical protein